MRKSKSIVLQDHVLHVIEIDSDEDASCLKDLQVQEELAIFRIEGTENQYTKSSAGNPWVLVEAPGAGPEWEFAKTNTIIGSMATSAGKILVFMPITSTSTPKPVYVAEANYDELDRESFEELGSFSSHRKMNANTYVAIPFEDEVTDEVIFE